MPRVLFFDDYPKASENEALLDQLRWSGIQVATVITISEFEQAVRQTDYDAIILDVMVRIAGILYRYDNQSVVVSEEETGIEFLRRLRGGYYKERAKRHVEIPIFMRTANNARHMQALYQREGGQYVDPADNRKLARMILEQVTS